MNVPLFICEFHECLFLFPFDLFSCSGVHTRSGVKCLSFETMTAVQATYIMRNRNNAKYLTGLFQMKSVMELQLQFCVNTTRADFNHPWRSEHIQNLLKVLGPDEQSQFMLTMDWARDAIDQDVLHEAIVHYYQKTRLLRARPCGDCGRWSVLAAAAQLELGFSGIITSTDIVWSSKKSRALMKKGKKMGHCDLCASMALSKKKKVHREKAGDLDPSSTKNPPVEHLNGTGDDTETVNAESVVGGIRKFVAGTPDAVLVDKTRASSPLAGPSPVIASASETLAREAVTPISPAKAVPSEETSDAPKQDGDGKHGIADVSATTNRLVVELEDAVFSCRH